MLIDGKLIRRRKTLAERNPYTAAVCRRVPIATQEDVARALELAHQARCRLAPRRRAALLRRVADQIARRRQDYARLITEESGLCLRDTLAEVDRVMATARYGAMVAETIEQDTTRRYLPNHEAARRGTPRLRVVTEPWDLLVAITPFNHPMNQVAHKVFPAVAAGTSVVLKPSPKTPVSALALGQLLHEAGLPNNMLNIVLSDRCAEIVGQLVSSPLVDMVTFTGSREVGLSIARRIVEADKGLKRYVPELGGCSSFIVHRDADLTRAAALAVQGCFGNSGQRCTAIRRIVVVDAVADAFVEQYVQQAQRLRYGNPSDPEMAMGTVISEDAAHLIANRVDGAIRDGAVLRLGHRRQGALYAPTIVDHVSLDSALVAKETFGPVGAVIRVHDLDGALDVAKRTEYALAGAIMTNSRAVAQRVADELAVGQFSWNGLPSYRTEAAPFGGFRGSGNGQKEGVVLAAEAMRRIRTIYEH